MKYITKILLASLLAVTFIGFTSFQSQAQCDEGYVLMRGNNGPDFTHQFGSIDYTTGQVDLWWFNISQGYTHMGLLDNGEFLYTISVSQNISTPFVWLEKYDYEGTIIDAIELTEFSSGMYDLPYKGGMTFTNDVLSIILVGNDDSTTSTVYNGKLMVKASHFPDVFSYSIYSVNLNSVPFEIEQEWSCENIINGGTISAMDYNSCDEEFYFIEVGNCGEESFTLDVFSLSPDGSNVEYVTNTNLSGLNQVGKIVGLTTGPKFPPTCEISSSISVTNIPGCTSYQFSPNLEVNDITEVSGYLWSFGDGTQSISPIVNHTFDNEGEYQVTLSVFGISNDGVGCASTTRTSIIANCP